MAKTTFRYTLTVAEQKLWKREDMRGWARAFQGCVEDDARNNGLKKYVIYDISGDVLVSERVAPLPQARPAERWRNPSV